MIFEIFVYVFYKNLVVCVFIIVNLFIVFLYFNFVMCIIKILYIVFVVYFDLVIFLVDFVRFDRSLGESLGCSGIKV